jgi:hypothetical protein
MDRERQADMIIWIKRQKEPNRWMEKTGRYDHLDGKDRQRQTYGWKRQIETYRWMKETNRWTKETNRWTKETDRDKQIDERDRQRPTDEWKRQMRHTDG